LGGAAPSAVAVAAMETPQCDAPAVVAAVTVAAVAGPAVTEGGNDRADTLSRFPYGLAAMGSVGRAGARAACWRRGWRRGAVSGPEDEEGEGSWKLLAAGARSSTLRSR
jgi:hypothetical protein